MELVWFEAVEQFADAFPCCLDGSFRGFAHQVLELGKDLFDRLLGNTFEDTGLANGTTYYYQVTAVSGGGESGKSNETFITTKPPAVTGLGATAGDSQNVLAWNASPTATS